MIEWIRTSRLSIKNYLSHAWVDAPSSKLEPMAFSIHGFGFRVYEAWVCSGSRVYLSLGIRGQATPREALINL